MRQAEWRIQSAADANAKVKAPRPTADMHPQLTQIVAELTAASVHAARFAQERAGRFGRRPHAHSWSAAECVQHLSITTRAFLPLIDEALAIPAAHRVEAAHRYRRDFAGRMLAWWLEPPYRMRTKTPSPFEPAGAGGNVLGEFGSLQRELIARVEACEGRELERHRIVSPFSAHVRYNLYSTLTIVPAHQRRHLWQADRALGALDGQSS